MNMIERAAMNMITGMIESAGVTPQQLGDAYRRVMAWEDRFAAWQAEIVAFKHGAGGMVARYDARLDAIEGQLVRIETLVSRLAAHAGVHDVPTIQPINGKAIDHE